ncbi:hypothetical protein [Sporosarcina sp. NPDC096371]|uniref:hypothetical protein n=1 Tax=Sporosarcina sp. NPDC096371 TaxID=3364530 RepID=UPI0038060815
MKSKKSRVYVKNFGILLLVVTMLCGIYPLPTQVNAMGKHSNESAAVLDKLIDDEISKNSLIALIVKVDKKQEENYIAESWTPFSRALANAKEVLAHIPSQAEIAVAFAQLTAALDELRSKNRNVGDSLKIVDKFGKAGKLARF